MTTQENNEKTSFYDTTEYLNILTSIPYERLIPYENEKKYITKVVKLLTFYQQKEILTKPEKAVLNQIINSINLDNIFAFFLTNIEKEYCQKEINIYNRNSFYKINQLDNIIDNGNFLQYYIEYMIKKNNNNNQINSDKVIIKTKK